MKLIKENVKGNDSYMLIINRTRIWTRDIIIIPHIILIEQFIQKHVKREWNIKDGLRSTCVVENFIEIPSINKIIACLVSSFNAIQVIKEGFNFSPINYSEFKDLSAREFILQKSAGEKSYEAIINEFYPDVFRFELEIRLVEANGKEDLLEKLKDKKFGSKQREAIKNEFKEIISLIDKENRRKNKLEKEKINLQTEIQEYETIRTKDSEELNTLTESSLRNERQKYIKDINEAGIIITNLKEKTARININIEVAKDNIKQIMQSRYLVCCHIVPKRI